MRYKKRVLFVVILIVILALDIRTQNFTFSNNNIKHINTRLTASDLIEGTRQSVNNLNRRDYPEKKLFSGEILHKYKSLYSESNNLIINSYGTLVERKWNGYTYFPFIPLLDNDFPRDQLIKARKSHEDSMEQNIVPLSGYSEIIPNPLNTSGNLSFVAILVEFQDVKFRSGHNTTYYSDILNNGSKPSLKTYYLENSYNQLNISVDVFGPVTSAYNLSYYGSDGTGIDDANGPIYELAREAVNLADSFIDYSKYDNNGDGYADAVLIIHSGTGQEYSKNSTDIWSHRWSISSPPYLDGVYVKDYSMQPEHYPPNLSHPNGSSILGVLVHEFGHILGLPDLYDVDYTSGGIGYWGLMGSGGWAGTIVPGDNPAHLSAWSKIFLGFVKPTPLTPLVTGFNSLDPVETGGDIIKLPIPGHIGEYFLLEYRSTTSGAFFDKGLPGSGLLIWHIDENVAFMNWDNDSWNNWDDNDVNMNETHYMVDVEEYDLHDGTQELENGINRGESTDVWSNDNIGFGDNTTPNATAYDGSNSGLWISNISTASTQISFFIQAKTIEIRDSLSIYNSLLTLESNITIVNSAKLSLVNSSMGVNSTRDNEFNIFVLNGTFEIVESGIYSLNSTNAYSIEVYSGSKLLIDNSNITDSDYMDSNPSGYGVIRGLDNSSIEVNNSLIARTYIGIHAINPRSLWVFRNTITNNSYGVLEQNCNGSMIIFNRFAGNDFGLFLNYSKNAQVEGNTFEGDNPVLWGDDVIHFTHVFGNNTVNNRPLHYIYGEQHVDVPNDGGPIIIVESRFVNIFNNNITNVDIAVQVAFSREVIINNTLINMTTYGLRMVNSMFSMINNSKVTGSTTGIYLTNVTDFSMEMSSIEKNKGDGLVVEGNSQLIRVYLSNIESNEGFGLINRANEAVNATRNWWGDQNGPEYKNTSDPFNPEEIWGNVTYSPWLNAKIGSIYIDIKSVDKPNRVIKGTSFYVNVTTYYNFISATSVKIEVIDTDSNTVLNVALDSISGSGNKQYNLTVQAKPYRTTMNLKVRASYNLTSVGWIVSSSHTFSVQVLPPEPTIIITSPSNGTKIYGKEVNVSWSITEGYYKVTLVEIRLDSNNWIDVSNVSSYTFNNLANGTHTVTLKATDSGGNTVSAKITIEVVQIKPHIEITSPTNNSIISSSNVTITWKIINGTFQISKVEIKIDNGAWIDVTGKTSYEFKNLTDGKHTVTIRVIDSYGYEDYDEVNFTVKTQQTTGGRTGTIQSNTLVIVAAGGVLIASIIIVILLKRRK